MAEINITFTAETTDLDKALTEEIKKIEQMGAEMGKTGSEMARDFKKLGEAMFNKKGNAGVDALKKNVKDIVATLKEYKAKQAELSKAETMDKTQYKEYEELGGQIDELTTKLGKYKAVLTGAEAAQEKDAKKASKSTEEFSKTVNGVTYSGETARNVLMKMQTALTQLEDQGKQNTQEYKNLAEATGSLKDSALDAQLAIKNMASDTRAFDTLLGATTTAAGGFSVVTGAMELFGGESDNVAEAQKRLQSVIAITTGLQSIQNNLQKQSALMMGISSIQTKALAKATAIETATKAAGTKATKGAIAAQKAFNIVAKANPYVLLAVALITVVGALTAFALGSKRASEMEAKQAERVRAGARLHYTYYNAIKETTRAMKEQVEFEGKLNSVGGATKRQQLQDQRALLNAQKDEYDTLRKSSKSAMLTIDSNREALKKKRMELEMINEAENMGVKLSKSDKKDNENLKKKLEAEIEVLEQDIQTGEELLTLKRELAIADAELAEQERQLAIAEANANLQATRKTEDLRRNGIKNKYTKERADINAEYDRQIEDIRIALKNERELTETQRAEMNDQIVLLEKEKNRKIKESLRQELNDRLQIEREIESLYSDMEREKLDTQDESLAKTIQTVQLEKQARLQALQEQKEAWIEAQGGALDKDGKYSDATKLTAGQKQYLIDMEKQINEIYGDGVEMLGTLVEQTIFEKYASGLQKAIKEQNNLKDEITTLKKYNKNDEVQQARTQQQDLALQYQESEQNATSAEFKRWVGTLVRYTEKELDGMIMQAETELAQLESDNDVTDEKIIKARAVLAAYKRERENAQLTGDRTDEIKQLNELQKVLGTSSEAFATLGQTGNEAFDKLMADTKEIIDSVINVVGAIQQEVKVAIEGEKQAAEAGSAAVKSVEDVSVILAIISAILVVVNKLKQANESTSDQTEQIRSEVQGLSADLRQLKRDMALDTSQNTTIFGDNTYKNIQQYRDAVQKFYKDYERAVDVAYEYTKQRDMAGGQGLFQNPFGTVRSQRNLGEDYFGKASDWVFDLDNSTYKAKNTVDDLAKAIENFKVKTQHGTWFRDAKFSTIKELAGNMELVGATTEETMANLEKFAESEYFARVDESLQKATTEAIANWQAYQDAVKGINDQMSDWFNGWASLIKDSISIGFEDGIATGKDNFRQGVSEMLDDFYLDMLIGSSKISNILDEAGKTVSQMMIDGYSSDKIVDYMVKTEKSVEAEYETNLNLYAEYKKRMEELGINATDAFDGTLSGAIAGASQESIDLLSGYTNAVRINQVDAIGIMRDQLIQLSGIANNTATMALSIQQLRTDFINYTQADGARAVGL